MKNLKLLLTIVFCGCALCIVSKLYAESPNREDVRRMESGTQTPEATLAVRAQADYEARMEEYKKISPNILRTEAFSKTVGAVSAGVGNAPPSGSAEPPSEVVSGRPGGLPDAGTVGGALMPGRPTITVPPPQPPVIVPPPTPPPAESAPIPARVKGVERIP